ncbi:MAG: sigma-70 family RNA polymerase sigma factor [Acetobacteraceae bacterium]|nr:sigma-70 family RNA polymerase sigma factor [Acetobacteraceae bacterium]
MTDETDSRLAALMAAAQDGDAASYASLLRHCLPIIATAARRQGVPPDRTDDVVQEVLLTIHRARATYDPSRPFLPWLNAIARRRAIDALRSHGRRAGHEVHAPLAYESAADHTPDPAERLDRPGEQRRLADAIAALPDAQRLSVQRLALGGQSLDQAAAETGRSKVALKVSLHRAIKTLRARLGNEGGDV